MEELTGGFELKVLEAARRVARQAIDDLLANAGTPHATVVEAAAGAGKTGLIVEAVGQARARDLRAAIATPTNDQCFGLVARLARAYPQEPITFLPASKVALPAAVGSLGNVVQARTAAETNGAGILVGTLDKLGDAFTRNALHERDLLMIDESFQTDSARYYGVANLAPTHLLVGDAGQLNPFSTIPDPQRWRGLPEDPLQTAVGLILRNHPARTAVYQLPLSRRLDNRAVAVAQTFYPGLHFDAAVAPGVRRLRLRPATASQGQARPIDPVLNSAAQSGWAHVELAAAPVLIADPEIIELICGLIQRLFARRPRVRCELEPSWSELRPQRVAIGVSHNEQKDLLRARLRSQGYADVVVETANKLQGLEFDVVLVWHPLAGLPDPDEFHLDPGRLCVLLTRHRHACILIGRASDRELVNRIPPSTPAYLGWDPDRMLNGYDLHAAVFDALKHYRIRGCD